MNQTTLAVQNPLIVVQYQELWSGEGKPALFRLLRNLRRCLWNDKSLILLDYQDLRTGMRFSTEVHLYSYEVSEDHKRFILHDWSDSEIEIPFSELESIVGWEEEDDMFEIKTRDYNLGISFLFFNR